ncbi:MAG: rhomboid family intramembrane serine protease [Spirochaetales bacterium]
MFIPIGDDNRDRRTTPIITYILIALNIFVFIFYQGWGTNYRFTYAYSMVPAEVLSGKDIVTPAQVRIDPFTGLRVRIPGLQPTPIPVLLTILTSMFMHGGIAHLLGNMLYLYIFGDNLEDRMGKVRFLLFYLACGVIASFSHVFVSATLESGLLIPTLGASGAISGVLGGYLILFPHKLVRVLFIQFILAVPAGIVLILWFLFQLINGLGYLGGVIEGGGVAYAAHIGGFISGVVLVNVFTPRRRYYYW